MIGLLQMKESIMLSIEGLKEVESLESELIKLNQKPFKKLAKVKKYAAYSVQTNSKNSDKVEAGYINRRKYSIAPDFGDGELSEGQLSEYKDVVDIVKFNSDLVDSFYFNWLQLAVFFESSLKAEGFYSHIRACDSPIRVSDGVPFYDLNQEDRRAALKQDNYTSDYKKYFERKSSQSPIAYTAIEGLTEMLHAYKWALNDGFSMASVHLMRAAIILKNLEIQKLERLHHIGRIKSEKSGGKKGSKYDGDVPEMQKVIDDYLKAKKGKAVSDNEMFKHLKYKGFGLGRGTFSNFLHEKKIKK